MRHTEWRVRLIGLAAIACLAIAGCGDDDGDGGSAENPALTASVPEANESPEAFSRELGKLISETERKRDCQALAAINARSIYRFPCPSPESVRTDFAFLEVLDSATHGTGAIVDYKTQESPDGATMVLFQSPGREWGISHYGLVTEASAESSDDESRDGYEKAINGYLQAVRKRDCDSYTEYAAMGTVDAKDLLAACKRVMPSTARLAGTLKSNPRSKPQYLGGSETYGFYRLETKKPGPVYMHFTVFKMPKGTLRPYLVQPPVFTAGPVATAAPAAGAPASGG